MANKKVSRGRQPTRDKESGAGGVAKGGSVADDAAGETRPFDVRMVHYLVRLMQRYELSEIDLREGEQRIRLQKGGRLAVAPAAPAAAPVSYAPAPAEIAPASTPPPGTNAPASPAPGKALKEIKSPTPGTFYSSANPTSEPFVKVGSKVKPETVVCIIEAMKIFNEINADVTGTVVEVCVENQQPVEFGQVLFRVDPAG
jgi:acetyl-CoA carboxylase biotin carboxyl carrier protein